MFRQNAIISTRSGWSPLHWNHRFLHTERTPRLSIVVMAEMPLWFTYSQSMSASWKISFLLHKWHYSGIRWWTHMHTRTHSSSLDNKSMWYNQIIQKYATWLVGKKLLPGSNSLQSHFTHKKKKHSMNAFPKIVTTDRHPASRHNPPPDPSRKKK